MLRKLLVGVISVGALAAAACATGTLYSVPDATAGDGGGADASGCPQYDLMTDPQHCGTCTTVCGSSQVCSSGKCKAQCDPPLVKCFGDGGTCVDTTKDPNNCGQCNNPCQLADAGGLEAGTNNPDAGIPLGDAGLDAGPAWSLGTPTCASSQCGVSCPSGMTLCSDDICYDTQSYHDHCGDCATACQPDIEWCDQGHCCATGKKWCTSQCIDVLNDANNCGDCGVVCPPSAPVCGGGACTSGVTYQQTFIQGQVPTAQCTAWQSFIASLGSGYTSMTLSGTLDTVGITCTDPTVVNNMAAALKNVTAYTGTCNGHTWSNCNRYNDELWIDPPSQCSLSNCPNPGYLLRACFGSANIWGCVNCNTCAAPTETVTLQFK